MLTKTDCQLLIQLLDRAADLFSNNGCNDFHLVNDGGLSPEEAYETQLDLFQWNEDSGATPPGKNDFWVQDWMLMQLLKDKLIEEQRK